MGVIIRNHDNNHNMLIYNCIYSNILPINSFVFISYSYCDNHEPKLGLSHACV